MGKWFAFVFGILQDALVHLEYDIYFTEVVTFFNTEIAGIVIPEHDVCCLPHVHEIDAHHAIPLLENKLILHNHHRFQQRTYPPYKITVILLPTKELDFIILLLIDQHGHLISQIGVQSFKELRFFSQIFFFIVLKILIYMHV